MKQRDAKRILLVEGEVERRLIPELIEGNGIDWGKQGSEIVRIESTTGKANLLTPGVISTFVKSSGLERIGIIVDADHDFATTWSAIRRQLIDECPGIPIDFPLEGLITIASPRLKVGVWIMPDNSTVGMLESLLTRIAQESGELLYGLADAIVASAKSAGAPFRDAHRDKAVIHTWLAWQDPPGRQLHQAFKERQFNPLSQATAPFVAWFKDLFLN